MNYQLTRLVLLGLLMTGCISSPEIHETKGAYLDPLEKFNRIMFHWNYNIIDPYIIRPLALLWRDMIPLPVRYGLINFTSNLSEPSSVVNYLLEGNPYQAGLHFNRFLLNTVLGMGGFIDVASMANPKLEKQDSRVFGNTLGYYNVGYGIYMVIPGYGRFTPREDLGGLVDYMYFPFSCFTWWMSVSKWLLEGVENRAQLLDYDIMIQENKDPYMFMRTTYFQHYDFLARKPHSTSQDTINHIVTQRMITEIDTI
ncbi:Intermembrane phospholipid transport system lipoprotein MlaA [Candidatus Erwinia haradaeae]|uniref:Intermembrane phospholipid transport system lipoprotein MlaA n=1 Tax=Candidatus Erwinia haradaeae TaxID=1922217 RepID=A0A451DD48_9GAMM|nr:MlaA family lipoprotein [Candidatus Erwinia haradaeae]VFP84329.1 Intermembrane phospholipid transport system lipoprotein MlaA [Candidatus Erwinia haradaeae]